MEYVEKNGFKTPVVFHEAEHLGLVVPRPSFTVSDVMYDTRGRAHDARSYVGSSRVLDVMDVSNQEALNMSMKGVTVFLLETAGHPI